MIVRPCAKINLGLYVTERRPDGYHNLQTVFYPIPITDEIEVERGETDTLSISGIPVAGNLDDNLVMRVVRLLRDEGYVVPPVNIHLQKNIPSGAGLGGGSSDAAFMMRLLNDMFSLEISEDRMEQLVGTLGADCAFFIRCAPVYATGIGNIFSSIKVDLSGYYLVLVKPDDFISTKEAYGNVHPHQPRFNLRDTIESDICMWQSMLRNDFEDSVFPQHPTVEGIKQKLYDLGAEYASMSGSGSSVFGIFRQPIKNLHYHFGEHFHTIMKL